jgi:hypothetical protein
MLEKKVRKMDGRTLGCKLKGKNKSDFFTKKITFFLLLFSLYSGQFHQHFGAKRKCTGNHSSAPVGAVQFHQQNYAQLHHYAQLENMLNFYAVRSTLCTSKIGVNLLA